MLRVSEDLSVFSHWMSYFGSMPWCHCSRANDRNPKHSTDGGQYFDVSLWNVLRREGWYTESGIGWDLVDKVCVGVRAHRHQGQGLQCQLSHQLIHEGTCVSLPQESSPYDFEMTVEISI